MDSYLQCFVVLDRGKNGKKPKRSVDQPSTPPSYQPQYRALFSCTRLLMRLIVYTEQTSFANAPFYCSESACTLPWLQNLGFLLPLAYFTPLDAASSADPDDCNSAWWCHKNFGRYRHTPYCTALVFDLLSSPLLSRLLSFPDANHIPLLLITLASPPLSLYSLTHLISFFRCFSMDFVIPSNQLLWEDADSYHFYSHLLHTLHSPSVYIAYMPIFFTQ